MWNEVHFIQVQRLEFRVQTLTFMRISWLSDPETFLTLWMNWKFASKSFFLRLRSHSTAISSHLCWNSSAQAVTARMDSLFMRHPQHLWSPSYCKETKLSFTDGNKNFLTVCADVVNELEFDSVEDIIKA